MSEPENPYASPSGDGAAAPSLPLDAAMAAVSRSFAIGGRTVLRTFLALSVILVLLQSLQGLPVSIQAIAGDLQMPSLLFAGQALGYLTNTVVIAGGFLIGGISLGLYRALRLGLLDGPDAVVELGTFSLARKRYGWALLSLLLFALMLVVGILMCVLPGIAVVIFLGMMPFLVVAADHDIGDAFGRSVKLFLANPAPILLGYLAVIVVQVVALLIGAVIGAIIGGISAMIGFAVEMPLTGVGVGSSLSGFVGGIVGIPFGYAALLIIGGVFTAVEAHDRGQALHLDDDILV